MRIWYDALTGKQVRYGAAIAKGLRSQGREVILTTRKHPDTLPLAESINEKLIVAGKYDPKSLLTRVEEGARRQLFFCKLFRNKAPDIAISHGSVDLCRVAFGLGRPIITTVDTPYAEAVHKLTLPLTRFIVTSKSIPKQILQPYNPNAEIVDFDGVDEVAWIKNFRPGTEYDFGKPLIVIRQLEEKAAYTKLRWNSLALAKRLARLGKVVFLSRYGRKSVKGLIVPKGFVDSASLVARADLFVGVGGTITREAALQGTPAIVVKQFENQYVNDFLIKKGFPIFKTDLSNTVDLAKKLLGKKYDVKHLLAELENPVDIVANIIKGIGKAAA